MTRTGIELQSLGPLANTLLIKPMFLIKRSLLKENGFLSFAGTVPSLCACIVVFVAASHQTRLDTRSKARRPIKVGIKGRGRSGTSRDSNPACQCCSSAHLVQCEPDEASSFTNPNVSPGTYASLRLKLDAWSSAVERGQKCSSPTRRLPSRNWGPIRPRVCSWFRAPIRHECQTAQLKSRERACIVHTSCQGLLGVSANCLDE